MSRRTADLFDCIRTQGGLLPADFLARIADPAEARNISGLSPADYHLAGSQKITEAINRSWNSLQGHWQDLKAKVAALPKEDAATGVTRDLWLLPLFQELGYGRLQSAPKQEIEGRSYPISHMWGHTPIHLLGVGLDLDRTTKGAAGAARMSPHSMVQEFLNRSTAHLWAIISNGHKLRLLRDNKTLTRQAFVEFDLFAMFEGEAYSDFVLLWLLCHQSRVESDRPENCILEKWTNESRQNGVRLLDGLRTGVEHAIEHLGAGFLAHPNNHALKERLRKGELSTQDYYRQILRQVYRFLFLFVAEDRELLLRPDASESAKTHYRRFYSTRRLRQLAERHGGTRHGDLWELLKLVTKALGSNEGCPALSLPALGSFLWRANDSTPDLINAALDNRHLLDAIRALATVRSEEEKVRRIVDYRNLGPEELGSVYESLLELHPEIHAESAVFKLNSSAGSDRKTTGSYYTPDSLVQCLLDSALEPVVKERLDEAKRMASGEWRMVAGPSRTAFLTYANQRLSRSGGLATGASLGQSGVSADPKVPQGGTLRHDLTNPSGGNLDPGQHSGGLGTALSGGAHPVSSEGQRQPDGIGNPSDCERGRGTLHGSGDPTATSGNDHSGQTNVGVGTQSPTETELAALWKSTPLATRHSLFAETALLSLKVCDKACGSGHFLIAAAHQLARTLAAIRSGEDEPSPLLYQHALRDVISRCIYGVDLNPMAVELCKITLWLEAIEPGKPLSFLDHHIQCGNSLLGATPALMAKGIPDEAFEPIEGDDKKYCSNFKKENKQEAKNIHGQSQGALFDREERPWERLGNLATGIAQLSSQSDDSLADVQAKEQKYAELVRSTGYEFGRQLADAWCAAFVWKKCPTAAGGFDYPITNDVFRRLERNPHDAPKWLRDEIKRLAGQYHFFHWHLAFPEVFQVPPAGQKPENKLCGWSGGFDVNLGNPPWDTLSPDAKEFFSTYDPKVRVQDKDGQAAIIEQLLLNPTIAALWQRTRRDLFASVHFFKSSGRYQLFAEGNLGKGDFNAFRMFVETALHNTRSNGFAAQLVPEGLYNGANCAAIRNALFSTCRLDCLLGFENAREVWFKNVHTALKFCLYVARVNGDTECFLAGFTIRSEQELARIRAGEALHVPVAMVREFSPDALAIMEFGDQRDIDIAVKMYARWPKFGDESKGPPIRNYMAEIHTGNDRELFGDFSTGLPLFEGRMVDHFDHRAKAYRSGRGRSAIWEELKFGQPEKGIKPQWRVPNENIPDKARSRLKRYRIGFCNVTGPRNERSLIAALIPPDCLSGDTVPTITFGDHDDWAYMPWLAVANSFAQDWLVRQKVQLHMTNTVLDSLPFPRLSKKDSLAHRLVPLALRLTCCGSEMTGYWNARAAEGWVEPVPADGPPPGVEDEAERLKLCAELDAIVARDVFDLTSSEMEYILTTFPTWREREEKRYGEFRTKRLILEKMSAQP